MLSSHSPVHGRAAAAACVACLLVGCSATPEESADWNVLLVVVDTLRADHLGAYGYGRPTSPAIDAFAAQSLVVEHAYAQSPWTKPSVASILTSLYSSQHRVQAESTGNRLDADIVTLPELLWVAGYRTAAFSKNPHIQKATGFGQGFEAFEARTGWKRSDNAWITSRAVAFLSNEAAGRPFFLYLHYLDPHEPFRPPPGIRAEVTSGLHTDRDAVRGGEFTPLLDHDNLDYPAVDFSEQDVAYLSALYDGEIMAIDREIATLLEALERAGQSERTLVLITSDHGDALDEHGRFGHGYDLYDEVLRIPFILHVPGSQARRERETVVRQIDIAPTVLDLLGLAVPDAFEGRSIAPLVRGETLGEAHAVAETFFRGQRRRSVRGAHWKLLVDDASGAVELYDVRADAQEQRDLSAARPDVARSLQTLLDAETGGAGAAPTGSVGEVDPELEAALRELGYLR